jgi:ubiquinone/menaquinone biosynthesis C-methylase UbiE
MAETASLSILHRLRAAEVETVKRWFPPGCRVLELGGGDGFQATLLAEMGCVVSSIDVAPRSGAGTAFHPVERYDGERIPFSDATFDVVFTSNVLEHIPDLPKVLGELSRVCRPDGYGVHLVPSTSWRFWTNLTHFPWLLRYALGGRGSMRAEEPNVANAMTRNTPRQLVSKMLGWAPHGERGSAWSELVLFSRRHWRGVLEAQGLEALHESDNSLFYTGHMLLSGLPMSTRRQLASALGGACHVFVVRSRNRIEADGPRGA